MTDTHVPLRFRGLPSKAVAPVKRPKTLILSADNPRTSPARREYFARRKRAAEARRLDRLASRARDRISRLIDELETLIRFGYRPDGAYLSDAELARLRKAMSFLLAAKIEGVDP